MVSSKISETVRVVDSAADAPSLPIIQGKGSAKAVIWPGTGALYRTFHLLDLKGGDRTCDLRHPTDSVYYVAEGAGRVVDAKSGEVWPLVVGSMVHIDRGDFYRFEADAEGVRLIGGPCPADEALYTLLSETQDLT